VEEEVGAGRVEEAEEVEGVGTMVDRAPWL